MSSVIRFEAVTKRYRVQSRQPLLARQLLRRLLQQPTRVDRHTALEDVGFEVERGESVGIVGPNGSGKTTLLSLVARTSHPTHGTVHVEGRIGPLLELGAGFHPSLTGLENLVLNASLLGLTREEVDERIDSIVEYAEIGDYIHAPVQAYSSGMIARIGFAVLAHVDPDILLVDEVLSVGDAGFRHKCEASMAGFRARGITQLLVSHNLALIERLCERVLWLDAGRVRADGPTSRVLQQYVESQDRAGEGR